MARLMPLLLTVSCFSKIQIGFTFMVPAHPGSPGKGAVKRVYIYIYMQIAVSLRLSLLRLKNCRYCYYDHEAVFTADELN